MKFKIWSGVLTGLLVLFGLVEAADETKGSGSGSAAPVMVLQYAGAPSRVPNHIELTSGQVKLFATLTSQLEDSVEDQVAHQVEVPLAEPMISPVTWQFLVDYFANSTTALGSLKSKSGLELCQIWKALDFLGLKQPSELSDTADQAAILQLTQALVENLRPQITPDLIDKLATENFNITGLPGLIDPTIELLVVLNDGKLRFYNILKIKVTFAYDYKSIIDAKDYGVNKSLLWVKSQNPAGRPQIQLYRLTPTGLVTLGDPVAGDEAGFDQTGQYLWMESQDPARRPQIQLYRLTPTGLVTLGDPVPGFKAGFDQTGQYLWIRSYNPTGRPQIKLYRLTPTGLVDPVSGDGAGLDQTGGAGFDQTGQYLWMKSQNPAGRPQIQLYRLTPTGLVTLDDPVPGYKARFDQTGQYLLVSSVNNAIEIEHAQIQLYRLTPTGLVTLGDSVAGFEAGFDQTGQYLWVSSVNNATGRAQIKLYRPTPTGLVALGDPVPGDEAGFDQTGQYLWVGTSIITKSSQIQLCRLTPTGLVTLGDPIPGFWAGFDQTRQYLWIRSHNYATWRFQIQPYCVTETGLVAIGAPVLGSYVGFAQSQLPDISNLNLLQQLLVSYLLDTHAAINLNDQLTLQKIYHSLKSELQSWLVKNKFVTDSTANTALKDIKMK